MVALTTPDAEFGKKAAAFKLRSAHDNKQYSLADCYGEKGLVVAFICNHCPYVKAIVTRKVREAKKLKEIGVGFVVINPNDAIRYPDDSFDKMQEFAAQHGFEFPYLHDETQEIAKKYGAVCTPDFFGFNKDLQLQYRGRLDKPPAVEDGQMLEDSRQHDSELFKAMQIISEVDKHDQKQLPSIGCSIKWKE